MTRETRLGIGVSSALLVLVVLAVAHAWLGGTDGADADAANGVAQAVPEPPAPAATSGATAAGHRGPGEGTTPQAPEVVPADFRLQHVPGSGAASGDPPVSIPSAGGNLMPAGPPGGAIGIPPVPGPPAAAATSVAGRRARGVEHGDANGPPPLPGPPGIDMPPPTAPGPVNVAQNIPGGGKAGRGTSSLPDADVPLPPGPPSGAHGHKKGLGESAANPGDAKVEEQLRKAKAARDGAGLPGPPAPPAGGEAEPGLPVPAPGGAAAGRQPAAGPPRVVPPPSAAAEVKPPKNARREHGKGLPPPLPGASGAPASAGGPTGSGGLPAPPGPPAPGGARPDGTASTAPTVPEPVGTLPSQRAATDLVPPGQGLVLPAGPAPGGPGPLSVALNNNAPVDKTPGLSGPTIRVPGPSAGPPGGQQVQVREYTEEKVRSRPGVQTFAAISKEKYGTPRYARALLLYNRDGNKELAANEGMLEDSDLPVGQKVFVPPATILESKYAAAVRDYQPRPALVAAAPVGGQPIASTPIAPAPAAPMPPPAGAAANIGRPAADGGLTYRVPPGNGEMLYQIARDRLGDAKRWVEIYRLNPDIQPAFAIPAGTVLRLPPGARTGS